MAELDTGISNDLREQQQAIGAVMRAVVSGGGLQPVLDEVVGSATRLSGGEYGVLSLTEGDVLRVAAHYRGEELFAHDQGRIHRRHRESVVGRVALEGGIVQIPDVLEDPDYTWPGQPLAGYRAVLGVPILFEDELVGAMAILRDAPGEYGPEQIEVVKTFADQAAIAIANARLLEALQRQLEQQRAIGDTLRAVARREGIQPVLDLILASATRLCEAENGRMWLVESDLLHAVANAGVEEGFEYDRANPHRFDNSSASGRAALTRTVVHIEDIEADPAYTYAGPPSVPGELSVPIQLEDELIGVIGMTRSEPRSFAKEQVDLVETFADQAAIAIANARLIDAVERQLDQQRAISDVLQAIALSEGLEAVFEAVVAAATRLCHGDFGALYLRDGDVFRLSTRHKWAPALDEFEQEHPHLIDRTSAIGRVALTRDVVHIPDVAEIRSMSGEEETSRSTTPCSAPR